MKPVKALFVGLNTVDLQFFVEGYPEANSKTKAHRNEIAAGGPATNAAIICAQLGAETTLLSPVGKHSLSRFLFDDITRHGVKVLDPIENIESKPVFASIITDEINGDRTVFSYHPESNYEEVIKELQIADLEKYSIALFDGFYPDLAIPLAKHFQKQGITTVFDGGSWKPGIDELLCYIDIAICSDDFTPPESSSKQDLFRVLKEKGCKHIAITRGENSILCTDKNQVVEIPVSPVEVTDTLGAGDFFHGAFCYYYAKSGNFQASLSNASKVAGNSCRFHGTRTWLEEIREVKNLI